ncbi:hypothetical protein XH89_14600 [Bradyrhizobium sp. CCBAU 53340]|nr:hypothetical protein XH89_14600 [Bradyrhizobium sp. CCBAU 53340]
MGPIVIVVARVTIHIFIMHPLISTHRAMVHIFHHASHVLLAHAVHAHAILLALLRRPVRFNAGIFGALTVALASLV